MHRMVLCFVGSRRLPTLPGRQRNSRAASGLKPTPSAPLLAFPPPRFTPHSGRSASSCCKSSATHYLAQVRLRTYLSEFDKQKRPCNAWAFLFVGSRRLPTLPGSQFAIVALLRLRLHRSLLTGLAARFIAHWARSPPPFASQALCVSQCNSPFVSALSGAGTGE